MSWRAEAVRWVREGVSSDEAADRWGIEPRAARARLLRASHRARVPVRSRPRRSSAECVSEAVPWVCKARRALGIPAAKSAARRARGYEAPCSSSAPAEGGRWVRLSEAVCV